MDRRLPAVALILVFLIFPGIGFCQDEWLMQQFEAAYQLVNQDRVAEAIALLEKTLKTEGDKKPSLSDRADILAEIGTLYSLTGDTQRSQAYLQQALAAKQTAYGPDHPIVGDMMIQMGEAAMMQENFTEAESYFENALKIHEAVGDRFMVNEIRSWLAELYQLQGKPRKAAAMRENIEGPPGAQAGERPAPTGAETHIEAQPVPQRQATPGSAGPPPSKREAAPVKPEPILPKDRPTPPSPPKRPTAIPEGTKPDETKPPASLGDL